MSAETFPCQRKLPFESFTSFSFKRFRRKVFEKMRQLKFLIIVREFQRLHTKQLTQKFVVFVWSTHTQEFIAGKNRKIEKCLKSLEKSLSGFFCSALCSSVIEAQHWSHSPINPMIWTLIRVQLNEHDKIGWMSSGCQHATSFSRLINWAVVFLSFTL